MEQIRASYKTDSFKKAYVEIAKSVKNAEDMNSVMLPILNIIVLNKNKVISETEIKSDGRIYSYSKSHSTVCLKYKSASMQVSIKMDRTGRKQMSAFMLIETQKKQRSTPTHILNMLFSKLALNKPVSYKEYTLLKTVEYGETHYYYSDNEKKLDFKESNLKKSIEELVYTEIVKNETNKDMIKLLKGKL